jgi:polysaccharide chain length determinant protein (PEP-CTERM system associated)
MAASPELDFTKIFGNLCRRKSLIAAVCLVIFSLSAYLAVNLPNVFQSSTVILVTPQKLPASYINSTVTASVQQRMRTIIEQILSRSRLESIITEFNLFPSSRPESSMEERIEDLRKRVRTEIRRDDTIQLSFEAESPEKAMHVTARLASLFIDENLHVREQQAVGTTAFINAEANRLRKELEEQEIQVNYYKSQYRNELPEQLDANLRTVQQLRTELQSNMLRLSSLEERKAGLEQQVAEFDLMPLLDGPGVASLDRGQAAPPGPLHAPKIQLETLLKQYSDKYPDVIRLKKEIAALEAQALTLQSKTTGSNSARIEPSRSRIQQTIISQLADLKSEINALQSANQALRGQIASYQTRADNTPVRAIEFAKISRTYDITVKKYQDLLAKSLESRLSENMEKSQKGEQFQISEQANLPEKPARPNRPRILIMGFLVGLAGGLGLAFLLDNLDRSLKTADDVKGYVNVSFLGSIPLVVTRDSILEQRRAQGLLVLVSIGALAVGCILIRLFSSSLPLL